MLTISVESHAATLISEIIYRCVRSETNKSEILRAQFSESELCDAARLSRSALLIFLVFFVNKKELLFVLEEVTRNIHEKNAEERRECPRACTVDGIVDFDAKEFFNMLFSAPHTVDKKRE